MVSHLALNQAIVGSNPTFPANIYKTSTKILVNSLKGGFFKSLFLKIVHKKDFRTNIIFSKIIIKEEGNEKNILLVSSLVLIVGTLFGCSKESNHNSYNSAVLPGKDRIWWYEGFENINEISDFIVKLKNTNKNGDFNFGISEFTLPEKYKCLSNVFSGRIDRHHSNKEDILNSVYEYFEIRSIYNEKTTILPNYNQIHLWFYPFYCENGTFDKENIKYTVLVQSVQLNRVVFSYHEDIIMEFELNEYSSKEIDMQVLIDELIENYRIIV